MDHGICLSWLTLFGTRIGNSNVTWFSSMLLSFGIAIQTTFFNINTDEKSMLPSEEWNKCEKVLHCLLLLAVSLITVSFFWSGTQRPKSQSRGTRQMNIKTSLYDLPEYSLSQLNCYNGSTEGGKIYVALNGKIFDVSEDRKQYNPGGSYKMLAGRDASRAFATLSFEGDSLRSDYDDLSDINDIQRSNLSEWENIFSQKYSIVGRMVHVHTPKSLQELSMKTISKSLLLCQPKGKWDCIVSIDSLPLPHRLKKRLRNYFHEHME